MHTSCGIVLECLTPGAPELNTSDNLHTAAAAVNGFFGLFSGYMASNDRRAVGHRIRDLRERRGLSREELAARVGVHAGSIARWETGGSVPHAYTLERIAEVCGGSAEYIRTGRGDEEGARGGGGAAGGGGEGNGSELFASLDAVVRFVEGMAPPGQERLRKLDALEGLRRMLTARGALPDWWYELKERVENGRL
jgi:transcriptional regulator with XRE-family HTH domain